MSSAVHFVIPSIFLIFCTLQPQLGWAQNSSGEYQALYQHNANIRQIRARDIRKYINLSVDPCHDFYEFACGNWSKQQKQQQQRQQQQYGNTLTPFESTTMQITNSINNELQRLLDEPARLEDSGLVRKAKDFYTTCVIAERNGAQQQTFLSEFIKQNGGFPAVPGSNWEMHHHNYEWLQTVAQLRKNYGMDILIGLRVDINYANVHENSLYLDEPSTLLPQMYCNAEGTKRLDMREKEYEQIEREVAENLKNWLALGVNMAKRVAREILTFEFELCAGMRDKATSSEEDLAAYYQANYERKNLIQFTHQFNDKLNLNDYMSNSFGTPIYMPVYMAAPTYIQHLIKSVAEFNRTTIANYIMYRAISMLTIPLGQATFKRNDFCLNTMKRYLPKALSELYARQYASESAKNEVQVVYGKVKEAFEQSLHSPWLDEATSRVGSRKLHDITLSFNEYERTQAHTLQINNHNFWQNLATVMRQAQTRTLNRLFENSPPRPGDEIAAYEQRMQFRPAHKRIDIGWGLMQPPFYHAAYGHAMQYAAIGQPLAQQLAIAFDELHWAVDLLERNSWDAQTAAAYRQRSKCFETQMSNYLHNSPNCFQNVSAVRQLIAQSAGLNVAFNAYLNWLHYQSPNNDFALLSKETLPDLNYSNTQLFFISFAQLQCHTDAASTSAQSGRVYSARQRHSLKRYAVNGPLRNSAEFARDFGCKAGTAMNPADKCVIY